MNFADYGEKINGFVDCAGGKSVWDSAENMLTENGKFSTIVGDDPTLADNSVTVELTILSFTKAMAKS